MPLIRLLLIVDLGDLPPGRFLADPSPTESLVSEVQSHLESLPEVKHVTVCPVPDRPWAP